MHRISTRLCLILLMTFAIVCSGCAVWGTKPDIKPISRDCLLGLTYVQFTDETWAWISRKTPPKEVMDWLDNNQAPGAVWKWLSLNDPPQVVINDIGKVAKNNQKLVRGCDNVSKPQ